MLEFLNVLERSNVSYVSWKNNHELNFALTGESDLDILIFNTSFCDFNIIAHQNGWIEMENPVAKFNSIYHYFKVNKDSTISHLHVYFELITGDGWIKEYNFPLKDFLFTNRESDKRSGVFILNRNAQAYIFFIRHLIKSGSLFSRFIYKRELNSYREEWSKCGVSANDLHGTGPISIDEYIKDSGLNQKFQQPKYMVAYNFRQYLRQYLRYKTLTLIFRRNISFFRRLFNKLISRNKKKFIGGGIVVAISGSDGAGKSSMIVGLNDLYSSFLDCKIYALGKPQGKLLELARSFIRRKDRIKQKHSYTLKKQSSLKDAILACTLAFLRLRKASIAVKKAREGNMVLVDRWPTNSHGKMDGPKIINYKTRNSLVSFLASIEQSIYQKIPEADLCFYLEVDIDDALKRNHERVKEGKESDEEIVMRHQNNHDIIPICKKLIKFSNTGPYKEMLPLLAYDIWREIATYKQRS